MGRGRYCFSHLGLTARTKSLSWGKELCSEYGREYTLAFPSTHGFLPAQDGGGGSAPSLPPRPSPPPSSSNPPPAPHAAASSS